MHPAEIEMVLGEMERFLNEGALLDHSMRVELSRYLNGVDQEGPERHPDLDEAIRNHPRGKELLRMLGWGEEPPTPATNEEVEKARTVLDRIERLLEAGARDRPEPRVQLRRLLEHLGAADPLRSPAFLRALEKRPHRIELMRTLEWRNSGEPPLRAQPLQHSRRACPYCGKVFKSNQSVGQCPKCGKVSEIIRAE